MVRLSRPCIAETMSEGYGLSDSEDDYSKEDKVLLEDARKCMKRKEISSDEEVYGFDQSDSENDYEGCPEEGEGQIDLGSDIEEEEKLPDERAWGKRKRSFYNTDFVDQDYEGVYLEGEAEIAELEEQEAKNIQKRLIEQLNEGDFSIAEAADIAETAEATEKQEVIQSDLSKLSKRQKLDLLKKESPEFFALVEDFKEKMMEAQKLFSVIYYFKKHVQKPVLGVQFIQIKLSLILNYCTNISYYLLLKAKRISVKNHPIMKSLFRYRQLLDQLEDANKKIDPELKKILEMLEAKKEIHIEDLMEKKEKKRLKLVAKHEQQREKMLTEKAKEESEGEEITREVEFEGVRVEKDVEEKRAITYEMAKNKGLIPKRSKEQRNPRVKHRRKYEKAKIRRRGQVRTPRTEIPVYGGEPTGIKTGLTKGIKLK